MSKHYSWKRLYEAIKSGNLLEVEESLFFLDGKVYENSLVHGSNALTLAAKSGHGEVVKLLLDHCIYGYENNAKDPLTAGIIRRANYSFFDILVQKGDAVIESFSDQIGVALVTAAQAQKQDVIDILLSYDHTIEEKYWIQALSWAARNGAYDMINKLMKKCMTQPLNRENTYSVILLTLYATGNNKLDSLDIEIRDDPNFYECFASFHPLHRSVFIGDRVFLRRLLRKYPYWYKVNYPDVDTEWTPPRNIFQVAANIGDLQCLAYLYKEASLLLGVDELRSMMTKVCVEVCEAGRWQVVQHCMKRGWIERSYKEVPQWSPKRKQEVMIRPFWGKMLNTALWTGHTALALHIMDKHYSKKTKNKVPSSSDLNEELQMYQHLLFCDSDWRNDVSIQAKIHGCLTSLAATEPGGSKSKRLPWEGEFLQCILGGFPDSVQYYLEQLSKTQIQQLFESFWYSLAHGTRMSVLNLELFGEYCTKGIDKLLSSNNNRWGANERSLDCFVEVLRQLLLNEECANRVDFKTLPGILRTWMVNCQTERCWRDVIYLFDFFDATHMWSTIFTFTELGHAFDLNNICRLLTIVCGTRLRRVNWPGLYSEAMTLNVSDRDALKTFVFNSGIRITDPEFKPEKSMEHAKLIEFPSLYGQTIAETCQDVCELKAPNASKTSLRGFCRVVIRRTIRLNSPKVSSLTDRILSLAVDRILPRPVVSYLLFRTELANLPPRTCMIKTRMSHSKRFHFSWEEEEYVFRTVSVTESDRPPRRHNSRRDRRSNIGNVARFRES